MIKLKDQICSQTTLENAWRKVLKNNGAAGGDGVSIQQFQRNWISQRSKISSQLRLGTYTYSSLKKYLIPKNNGTTRRLMVPSVGDRVVLTAIAQILMPVLEPHFEESSFAYRPGRSVKQAVTAIEYLRDKGYQYVIDADITNYFEQINHKILIKTFKKHIGDLPDAGFVCDLIGDIVDHQGIEMETPGKGIAQGSPLSPLLANLYLDYLDEKIESRGVRIIRFADDFVILCKTLKATDRALEDLGDILQSLDLELNKEKSRLVNFDKGFEFLGYLFVRSLAMQRKPENFTNIPLSKENKALYSPSPTEQSLIEETKGRTDYSKGDRVLYVLERGRKLSADGQSIEVQTQDGHPVLELGIQQIDRIEIGPAVSVAQNILHLCLKNEVQLIFQNGWGEQLGRLVPNEDKHCALQYAQAQHCGNTQMATELARVTVEARIRNQRTQLFRLNRTRKLNEVKETLRKMGRNLRKLPYATSIAQIRGLEGASGALYWPSLNKLCTTFEAQNFRRTRPGTDPLNATINYLTFLLERDVRSAIRAVGLHVGFGFLHLPQDRSQAAVYDLMEPFRAPLSEGLPVYLFNARRLKLDMFSSNEDNTIWMNKEARKAVITGYEQAVAKRINITGSRRKLSWRRMMWFQANSLAKAYRSNDITLFKPYLMDA